MDELEGNILDLDILHNLFTKEQPEIVINYEEDTAVDNAEDDFESREKISKNGAAFPTKLCATFNTTLIHLSTNFGYEVN